MARGVDLIGFVMEVQPCERELRGAKGWLSQYTYAEIIYEGRTDERERKDCSQKIGSYEGQRK